MIDLNELADDMRFVALQRQRNGANIDTTPLGILKHCATEVVEAMGAYKEMEVFLAHTYTQPMNEDLKDRLFSTLGSELADIIACVLDFSSYYIIDIEEKLKLNYARNLARAEGRGDKL